MKAGRHCIVDLNGGSVAAELLKDAASATAKAADKAKKGRRKEGSSDSDTKSEKGSVKNGKAEPKEPPAAAKSFVVGDYPPIDVRSLTATSRAVFVSHYNSWKELWVQVEPDTAVLNTKHLNENTDLLGDTVTDVKVINQSIKILYFCFLSITVQLLFFP